MPQPIVRTGLVRWWRTGAGGRPRALCRPTVEPLENRRVPAVLGVLSGGPDDPAGTGASFPVAFSADGHYAVFASAAADVVAGQNNASPYANLFLLDGDTGQVTLINHLPDQAATTGNGGLGDLDPSGPPDYLLPSISDDGSVVAFASYDTDLVTGESLPDGAPEGVLCLYLYDTQSGEIHLVNHQPGATALIDPAHQGADLALSADGSHLAYVSGDLAAGGTLTVYDAGSDTLLDTGSPASGRPAVSTNGDVISYPRDGELHVYEAGQDRRIPLVLDGPPSGGGTVTLTGGLPPISTDSPVVLPGSPGVPVHLNPPPDGLVVVPTHPVVHLPAHPGPPLGVLSRDGRYIVFVRAASLSLIPDPTRSGILVPRTGVRDVYLYEVSTGITTLVSHRADSLTVGGNGNSDNPVIAADDSAVAFRSDATDLVTGQVSGSNVYSYDVGTGAITLISHVADDPTTAAGGASDPVISPDGRLVAYVSSAGDVVSAQSGPAGFKNVFVWVRSSGVSILASGRYGSSTVTADGNSDAPKLLGHRFAAFHSDANDLVPGVGGDSSTTYLSALVEVKLTPNAVADGSAAGTPVGTLTAVSLVDGQLVSPQFQLPEGDADNAAFGLSRGGQGGPVLVTQFQANAGVRSTYSVEVHVDVGFRGGLADLPVYVGGGGGTSTADPTGVRGAGAGNGGAGGTGGKGSGGGGKTGAGAEDARVVPVRGGGRRGRLVILVFVRATGAVARTLVCPFQGPAYTNIRTQTVDANHDGVPDAVLITARRGRRRVSATLPL